MTIMPSIDRVCRLGQEPNTHVDTVEAIEVVVRAGEPGRYHVDEISADPLQAAACRGGGASGSSGPMAGSRSRRTSGLSRNDLHGAVFSSAPFLCSVTPERDQRSDHEKSPKLRLTKALVSSERTFTCLIT